MLQRAGAKVTFSSRIVDQVIGERSLSQTRALEFPNVAMLIDAMRSDEFASAMTILFNATDDHSWTLGVRTPLPFEPSGGYVDPRLQNLATRDAIALLNANGGAHILNALAEFGL